MPDYPSLLKYLLSNRALLFSNRFIFPAGLLLAGIFFHFIAQFVQINPTPYLITTLAWLTSLLLLVTRETFVLPYQQEKLDRIESKIFNNDLEGAKAEISQKRTLESHAFSFRKKLLESRILKREGLILQSYTNLCSIPTEALLPEELSSIKLLQVSLYLESGNYRDARDSLKKVDHKLLKSKYEETIHILLTSTLMELNGDVKESKAVLEQQLIKSKPNSDAKTAAIYHDIARLENYQGNHNIATGLYIQAWDILKKTKRFQEQLGTAHDLALLYARLGKKEAAVGILKEVEHFVEPQNIHQLSAYSNLKLKIARQLDDQVLIKQVYDFSVNQIEPLASDKQKLILFITQVSMHEIDDVNLTQHLHKTIHYLTKFNDTLSLQEKLNAYRMLLVTLTQYASPNNHKSQEYYEYICEIFKECVEESKDEYPNIPLSLPSLRVENLRHRITLLNLIPEPLPPSIQQTEETINLLREIRLTWHDKDNHALELDALLLTLTACLDYLGHHGVQSEPKDRLEMTAKDTLKKANSLLEINKKQPDMENYLVGVAWFNYKISSNFDLASYWMKRYDNLKISPNHLSVQHRDFYFEIQHWLNSKSKPLQVGE